jgi:hypothetical protein
VDASPVIEKKRQRKAAAAKPAAEKKTAVKKEAAVPTGKTVKVGKPKPRSLLPLH